ncbi:MAG: STAS domain-containing protein [Deltaproteobacteria bacterium]|nr:STAS domain-containing protein [Deltaproteobacteria bacterium]
MSEILRKEKQVIIVPGKDTVASMVQDFKRELRSLVEEGVRELIIDLAGVGLIDSVGLGVLIATYNSLRKVGGRLILTQVSREIYCLFKTMRLDQHFEIQIVQ